MTKHKTARIPIPRRLYMLWNETERGWESWVVDFSLCSAQRRLCDWSNDSRSRLKIVRVK